MAQTNYIPAKDADFAAWLLNFATLIAAGPTTYGLIAGDATIISAANTAFQDAYTVATTPATRTSAAIAQKDSARASATATVRPYAVQISLNSGVDDMDKVEVGVTVRKTTPTPIPPPTTQPVLILVQQNPGALTLGYRDITTPNAKAKPFGAIGIELWTSLGAVFATDPEQCVYYGTITKSPNLLAFGGADAGKKLTMFARWVTRGGAGGKSVPGPWSAPLTTIVT